MILVCVVSMSSYEWLFACYFVSISSSFFVGKEIINLFLFFLQDEIREYHHEVKFTLGQCLALVNLGS